MIGFYELLGQVARTPTATVWKGRDLDLDRTVAVKQVDDRATESAARLRSETRLHALGYRVAAS